MQLQESFLEENRENKKMLDIYIKFAEGSASSDELELANSQLRQILKNLGLGILLILVPQQSKYFKLSIFGIFVINV